VVRESPLHAGHLKLMTDATAAGAVIFPPVPAFYHRPVTAEDIVDQTVARVLDQLDVETHLFRRWSGTVSLPDRRGPGA
jgi:4-hydroxy-3-polyprenylbenzoate decarboxylase